MSYSANIWPFSNTHKDQNYVEKPKTEIEAINEKVARVYACSALAFAVTFASAFISARLGFAVKIISGFASGSITPLFLIAVGVALLAMTYFTSKESSILKKSLYGMFAAWEGMIISPLVLVNASAFVAASATTIAIVGGLGVLAMSLKESFEKYETIMLVALGAIALASFGSLILPSVAASFAHEVSLIGGLAVFSGFVILDTHKARSQALDPKFDEVDHSLNVYLDAVNLLIRLWECFERTQRK